MVVSYIVASVVTRAIALLLHREVDTARNRAKSLVKDGS